jgi:hypothetical protein
LAPTNSEAGIRSVREDYFRLIYLEQEHKVPREKAVNQVAFGSAVENRDESNFRPRPLKFSVLCDKARFEGINIVLMRTVRGGGELMAYEGTEVRAS